VNDPKHILIIRMSAIGDVVFASAMISALRSRYPHTRLSWLAEQPAAQLLQHHPGLDEVIVLPRSHWKQLRGDRHYLKIFREMRAFARELRARQIDWALDCQGLLKSAVWAWFSGAKRRIGLGSKEGSRLLMTETLDRDANIEHFASEYRHLVEYLDCRREAWQYNFDCGEAANQDAAALMAKHHLKDGYIALCPFTTRPQKHWFDDNWTRLLAELQSTGLPLVMLGGPGDVDHAQHLATHSVINLTGQTGLLTSAALLQQATLIIGVDTGLTHMGTAFGRPTVCLFGSTIPYRMTDNPGTVVLYHQLPCSPCHRRPTCEGAFTCMQEITPAQVAATANKLLAAA